MDGAYDRSRPIRTRGRTRAALRAVAGADATIAMATRATQGLAMAAGAGFVLWRMSPADQGFYFTFISFGLLLQLCDFGLSYASLQAASHLQAIGRRAGLSAVATRAAAINGVVTGLAAPVVAVLGWWVFASRGGDAGSAWGAPWLAFVAVVAANQWTAPFVFIVEGGLSVGRAWRFKLGQEIASGLALFAVLAGGEGLWALVAYYAMRATTAAGWTARVLRRRGRSDDATADAGQVGAADPPLRWRSDLWPFQWRVGLGAVGNYLAFQAIGPILFAFVGPAPAGRFALSLAVMNALVMITTAWPISQAAHFGVLVGRGEGRDLTRRWRRMMVRSTAFAAGGASAAAGAFVVFGHVLPDAATRFAGGTATSLLIATAVLHHVVACIAVVVRAGRRDPLLPIGLAGGVVTVAAMTVPVARGAALSWVALAYLVGTAATLPFAVRAYRRFAARSATTDDGSAALPPPRAT